MKIARYQAGSTDEHGLVLDDQLHPLPAGTSVLELLAARPGQEDVLGRCGAPVPVSSVRLLPPVQPGSVRDFLTFEQHVEGARAAMGENRLPEAWYEIPTFYFTNPYALVGAHDPVPVPPGCQVFDFELEVAAIIGWAGSNLTVEQAGEHILGYSIFNDWSARDLQRHEQSIGLGPAKGKDTASTLGPYLVTPDELEPYRDGDRYDLAMTVSLNGTVFGTDTLASAAWSFPELIAYASRGTVVRPGDVLGSGTCGNGCLMETWGRRGERQPPPLAVGDVVTMTVAGLGTIENTVVAGQPVHPVPPARRRVHAS